MGRYAKEPEGGGDFERAPLGTHLGICYRIYELGTQHKEFDGEERVSKELVICFELPTEIMADGRPFGVSAFYTYSLHEKAKLRAHLTAWRGKPFTEKELQGFDMENILGKACLLNIGSTKSGREKVLGISALIKGMPVPQPVNEQFAFWIDEWDDELFKKIPDGFQKMIKRSDEYKLKMGQSLDTEPEPDYPTADEPMWTQQPKEKVPF